MKYIYVLHLIIYITTTYVNITMIKTFSKNKPQLNGDGKRLDLGCRTHNAMYR